MAVMSHPDFLPTGQSTVGIRRVWGEAEPEKRKGVGVVGLHEGKTMLIALRASNLCRAVAGCDLDPEKRQAARALSPELAVFESLDEMLAMPEVDIVAIYTPDALHAEQIERCFRAGKHVICTKPLINDLSQAERLRQAASDTGMRLQVGQSTRFFEPFLRQREDFEAGEFGQVETVDSHYHHRMDWYYEKSPWSLESTHWAYLGMSHPIDYVRWYLGPIRQVHAVGSRSALARKYGLPTPDVISAHFVAEDGRIGRAFSNFGGHELPRGRSLIEGFLMGDVGTSLARYPDLRYTHVGSGGVEIEEDFHQAMAGYYYRHELKGMHYGEFCNIADSFAARLLDRAPNHPDLDEGLETVRVMAAVVQSLESGRTVEL